MSSGVKQTPVSKNTQTEVDAILETVNHEFEMQNTKIATLEDQLYRQQELSAIIKGLYEQINYMRDQSELKRRKMVLNFARKRDEKILGAIFPAAVKSAIYGNMPKINPPTQPKFGRPKMSDSMKKFSHTKKHLSPLKAAYQDPLHDLNRTDRLRAKSQAKTAAFFPQTFEQQQPQPLQKFVTPQVAKLHEQRSAESARMRKTHSSYYKTVDCDSQLQVDKNNHFPYITANNTRYGTSG